MWIRCMCLRFNVRISTEDLKRTDGRSVTEKPNLTLLERDRGEESQWSTERSAGSLDSEILQQQQLWAGYIENWKVNIRVQAGCAEGYHFSPHSSQLIFNLIDHRTKHICILLSICVYYHNNNNINNILSY